jgi:osmotically-inducible protein OsmY
MTVMHRRYILGVLAFLPAAIADEKKDNEIYDQVRRRLAGDPDIKGGALEVDVKDGVVRVRGVVRTDKAKAKADRVIGRVKGVTKVVNELKVSATGV